MKKAIKVAIISGITLVSGTAFAAAAPSSSTSGFIDEVCSLAPFVCSVSLDGNGRGFQPKKPGEPEKDNE